MRASGVLLTRMSLYEKKHAQNSPLLPLLFLALRVGEVARKGKICIPMIIIDLIGIYNVFFDVDKVN